VKSADLIVSDCQHLLTCHGPLPKRREALRDVGLIERGCIASFRGRIVFIGESKRLKDEVRLIKDGLLIDAGGMTALPGFVDPHTHLPFAGSREKEFELRLQGHSYRELTEKGMGIQTTVNATRNATKSELTSLCLDRLDSMLLHGTTTAEAKSGYGLNLDDEVKQLNVIHELERIHPIDIIPTFMGAHEIPKEYKHKKKDYIDLLIQKILPEVKKMKLAEFFDVFCEEGVFSVEETRLLIKAAKKSGFKIRIHADEFTSIGGAELAAEVGASSADHLVAITDKGIEQIANSNTAATLLPSVSFFLMLEKKAPARRLIDKGAIVALASDFNPGSSMTESMLFIIQLAVYTLKMGMEEAVNAATANAAYALEKHHEVGSLEIGKKMDLLLCQSPSYSYLFYHLGINPIKYVIKNGKIVAQDGNLTYR
jgi:imidazolonepropionase